MDNKCGCSWGGAVRVFFHHLCYGPLTLGLVSALEGAARKPQDLRVGCSQMLGSHEYQAKDLKGAEEALGTLK